MTNLSSLLISSWNLWNQVRLPRLLRSVTWQHPREDPRHGRGSARVSVVRMAQFVYVIGLHAVQFGNNWMRSSKFYVRDSSCHENIKFISSSKRYYINELMTPFLTIFRRFPTTFRRSPKIFQNCSEGLTNVSEQFSNISEHFPKITEDCQRLPKATEDVSIIHQQILV